MQSHPKHSTAKHNKPKHSNMRTHTVSYLNIYMAIDTFGLYMYVFIYLYTHHRKNEWLLIESFSLRFFCICGRAYRRRRLTKNAIAFSVIEPCVIFISISPVNFLHFCFFFASVCAKARARDVCYLAHMWVQWSIAFFRLNLLFLRCVLGNFLSNIIWIVFNIDPIGWFLHVFFDHLHLLTLTDYHHSNP